MCKPYDNYSACLGLLLPPLPTPSPLAGIQHFKPVLAIILLQQQAEFWSQELLTMLSHCNHFKFARKHPEYQLRNITFQPLFFHDYRDTVNKESRQQHQEKSFPSRMTVRKVYQINDFSSSSRKMTAFQNLQPSDSLSF